MGTRWRLIRKGGVTAPLALCWLAAHSGSLIGILGQTHGLWECQRGVVENKNTSVEELATALSLVNEK